MKDWQYIGDEKQIRALELVSLMADKYNSVGVYVSEQGVWQVARFLFPEAFESALERLAHLARPQIDL